jgi:hypothetical protein
MRSCPLSVSLVALATLAGCSARSPAPADPPDVRGVYVATSAGPITDLTFVDAESYVLRPAGRADDACLEHGTYAFDVAGETLTTDPSSKTTVTCIAGQLAAKSSVAFQSLPLTCPDGWTTVPTQ